MTSQADGAGLARCHSRLASVPSSTAARPQPAARSHSSEPLCASGCRPVTPSIQSGHTAVSRARTPAMPARTDSGQKMGRSRLLMRDPFGTDLTLAGPRTSTRVVQIRPSAQSQRPAAWCPREDRARQNCCRPATFVYHLSAPLSRCERVCALLQALSSGRFPMSTPRPGNTPRPCALRGEGSSENSSLELAKPTRTLTLGGRRAAGQHQPASRCVMEALNRTLSEVCGSTRLMPRRQNHNRGAS